MSCFSEEQLNRISCLIREIEKLSDAEKLFLYLQLPCGRAEGKSKYNGTRSDLFSKKPDQETTQTYTWILSHLEIDPSVSLPKQEVYDEYRLFCQANRFEPLCVADFGKAMKYAFPCIKPRRLGQRGNSRYCYSGLRKKHKIQPPNLPELIGPTFCVDDDCSQAYNQTIRDCHDNLNDCPLTRQGTCEVMNLKIVQSQQGLHDSGIYHDLNGNGIPDYSVGGHIGGKQHAHNSQILQNMYPIQRPLSLDGVNNSNSNNISMVLQHQQGPINVYSGQTSLAEQPHQPHQPPTIQQTPQTPVPMTQDNHHRRQENCDHLSIIQQPGSPDDDDYRHNYQDITSVNRHLFDTATTNCQHNLTTTASGIDTIQPVHTHQSMAPCGKMITTSSSGNEGDNYIYQQSTMANNKIPHRRGPQATILDNRPQQQTPQPQSQSQSQLHQQKQQQQISDNRNSPSNSTEHQVNAETNGLTNQSDEHHHGSYIENSLNNSQENHNMLNLSHMSSSYIDSCASPFQSPTSTPYPLIGSYLTNDIQDYYSDDCLQYSNAQ